ncbi:MAG: type II toxin-antitoxin system RelE/ParE family toxin [Candidatus Methylomirabilis oxygeniifera]|nr:MAG: type II toxin-antitoxin system RelE/ParE family toxin [Candidatus Methylomirabilis oxyfera]
MAYRLEFYKTASGEEPALDYIRTQVTAHRAKIGRALQYLEDTGHQARRPQVDYLGDDIYELRVAIDRHQHRLLYFFHGQSIIVVAIGILKNEGRVPPSAITRARTARADWLERCGGKT